MWGNPLSTTWNRILWNQLYIASSLTIVIYFLTFRGQDNKGKGSQRPWECSSPQHYHSREIAPHLPMIPAKVSAHRAAPFWVAMHLWRDVPPCVSWNALTLFLFWYWYDGRGRGGGFDETEAMTKTTVEAATGVTPLNSLVYIEVRLNRHFCNALIIFIAPN